MKVLLMGALGNMGQRYAAILRHLGIDYSVHDVRFSLESSAQGCDRVIIATPTDVHATSILEALKYLPGKPILCEKPITKDLKELNSLIEACKAAKSDLRVVYQYKSIYKEAFEHGPTRYNYFKHGNDGLFWDCYQVVGLAHGLITLRDDSPIWDCTINGQRLNIADMDSAYISYVADWIQNPRLCVGVTEILDTHKKVQELIDARS